MKGQSLFGVRLATLFVAAVVLSIVETGQATEVTYLLNMDGAQEAPGPGDPDGLASGFITLNDVSGLISWGITYSNLDALSNMHIHGPNAPPGTPAGVYIGLGIGGSGGPGQLINTIIYGGSLADITAIFNNPIGFYVNIHTTVFPPGAVRGQLGTVPAPGALALLALGGLAQRRRRR